MLDEHGEIPPFGWAVGVAGRPSEQIEHGVRALVEWSAAAWKQHFPPERGYQVQVEAHRDAAGGVRMTARRGDFHAEATVEHDPPAAGARSAASRGPSVRAFGRAHFLPIAEAALRGERATRLGRIAGGAGGLSIFLTLAWLMIGVNDPIYVLGGMLLVVTLVMTLMAGVLLGGFLGERVGVSGSLRARRDVEQAPGFGDDLRRWKAMSRQLLAQRAAFAARRGQPFRSEPTGLAS